MILGGVFHRLPGLKVILGHIPFHLPRIDDTLTPLAGQLVMPVSGYFREHFWITTSGYFYDGPFRLTREMFGDDRLIFSVDYPLADNRQARDWFDRLDLAPEVREKIAHGTVDNLLRLPALSAELKRARRVNQAAELMPSGDIQLGVRAVQVRGDGTGRQEQAVSDLTIGEAVAGEDRDLALLRRETGKATRKGRCCVDCDAASAHMTSHLDRRQSPHREQRRPADLGVSG
jgi:Amidohydrolase